MSSSLDPPASPVEETVNPVAAALVDRTIAMIAGRGMDAMSLRTIAAEAGCSTAFIFQRFGNREGLVTAAIDAAIAADAAAHAAISAELTTLSLAGPPIADLIAGYVERRARDTVARFLATMVMAGANLGTSALANWHCARVAFWQDRIVRAGGTAEFGAIVAAYVAMEEYYAFALHRRLRYGLLLHETCRALTAGLSEHPSPGGRNATLVASLNAIPLPRASPARDGPELREQLLDHAVDEITRHGIAAVNQRKITRRAHVSGSAIAYYFGDMTSFVNEAIWRALLTDIPRELDPTLRLDEQTMTMTAWLTSLSDYMHAADASRPPGFYTSYARITAQACLLVETRPELLPLAAYLRELDGWGTYRAGRQIPETARLIQRDHAAAFAIWIKAIAVLNDVGITAEPIDPPRLLAAANALMRLDGASIPSEPGH